MCGFVGCIDINISYGKLKKATKTIIHRGPDATTITKGKNWIVGFNRLAIIDLNKRSMQPFKYKNILVFLNGEIFNYLELIKKEKNFFPKTKSDVEIIPYLYEKYGMDFLKMLNGMFSIILIDEKRDKLFLIRDRYGEKPLFYLKNKKGLYFASEIRAIKELTNIEIEKKNIEINFRCGFLPQPLTLYKDLNALEAGHYIEVFKNKITKSKWYNLKLDNDLSDNFNFKTAKNSFLKAFDNSIKIRSRSDVKIGLFLSGGLDSNFIFHRLKKLTNKVTLLYCNIPSKFQKEKNKTDVNVKLNGSKYNFIKADLNYNYFNKNIVKIINNHDNILFDSSIIIFYFLSGVAQKKKIKVVLSGNGGDELFGGYPWQYQIRHIPTFINKLIFSKQTYFLEILYNFFYKLKVFKKIKNILNVVHCPLVWHLKSWDNKFGSFLGIESKSLKKKLFNLNKFFYTDVSKTKNLDFFNKFNFLSMKIFGVEQHHKVDLSSMFHSVENRSPFYDHEVVRTMLSINDFEKNKGGHKGLLRNFGEGILPKNILNKKKSGPALNIEFYFSKNLNKILQFILKNDHFFKKYISNIFYKNIKEKLTELDPKKDMDLIFCLVNFVIWCKINIDNSVKDLNITFDELIKNY